ncbi:DNA polymerase [Rhizobium leguminosarum]|uniref:DNA-directed DNA polymerase family A palm domain-containing protein n=1 Tax=Rhizobium leguminosarum TaxID=384 RepID=A0A6P0B767_RHILE|nr:DNA polymerase [Rhizobium leguminosarum]MBY5438548.1 hypothetical protein [Rhizobium leguminosarum]NEI35750.1 hypothetical protein [Rhizobium leguminosarum]NEI42133.1 hypothetical protein [Rhizobium leguminosarum]
MPENMLLYAPDPYGVGASRFAVVEGGVSREISAQQLGELKGTWITYDVATLIDELRRCDVPPPVGLLDISEAIRLITGRSRADGGESQWNFWRQLKSHFDDETKWRLARELHEGRGPSWQEIDKSSYFTSLAAALAKLWTATTKSLVDVGELERFFEIEVPTAAIYYSRQWEGIGVAPDKVKAALEIAAHRKYLAYQQVATFINASPTGLNYWNVGPYLAGTDFGASMSSSDGYTLRDQLRLAQSASKFASSFIEYMDASRDVEILNRLNDSEGRVYPTFHPIGTISSRTLVSDPYLQELRRTFRHVLSADEGKRLVYFDYSQFEPGVLASLSGDEELISLYNNGDVYTALSVALFGNSEHRDLCKRIFLAFSYGMSVDGITRLLSHNEAERKSIGAGVRDFFDRFPRLHEFKMEAERELRTIGRVRTLLGNRRVRSGQGALTAKERRWATSQVIQGNASLIFKHALIRIADKFGLPSILLPVHDAVLMQCSEHDYEGLAAEVSEIMRTSFAFWCPGIQARVTVGHFGTQ